MEYTLPTKAADFVEGGDGYDLEHVFTKVFDGTTCTYDDIIFMPGRWNSACCARMFYDRLHRREPLMETIILLSTGLFDGPFLTACRFHRLPHGPGGSDDPFL